MKGIVVFVSAVLVALAAAAQASADPFVPSALRQAALAHPAQTFKVIVQGAPNVSSKGVAGDVQSEEHSSPGRERGLKRSFRLLNGVSAELTGRQILALSSQRRILAITPDVPLNANVIDPPANLVPPSVAGTPEQNATLSALNGEWTGGTLPYGDFTYQWSRCDAGGAACVAIAGATSSNYVATVDDVGATVAVAVTATDAVGVTATAVSAASAQVQAPPAPQLVPPANVTAPVVSGIARAGETLTAVEGAWQGTVPLTYGFQWQRCAADCTDIAGATTATYGLTAPDVGFALRVVVSAQDAGGSTVALSAQTATITAADPAPAPLVPPANVSLPAVSGVAREGETLSATAGQWQGSAAMTYVFQWQRCAPDCTDTAGATGATYAAAAADVGFALRVVVTAQDADGSTTALSAQTATVTAAVPAPLLLPPANLSPPVISGVARDGETLSAALGQWQGGDPMTYGYQWQRCGVDCADIAGATAATYGVTNADIGSALRVVVTAQDATGSTSAVSEQSANVTPAPLQSVNAPTIVIVDSVASVDTGAWSGGAAPLSFTYRWQRCASQCIDVATDSAYRLTADDAGAMLAVAVTATDANGDTASVMESVPVPAVVTPPENVDPPSIDASYHASTGGWKGDAPQFAYTWSRCDEAGSNCVDIVGATTDAYAPAAADIGATLRVTVTATNDFGSVSARSAATPRVPPPTASGYWNWEMWPYAVHADALWGGAASPPAIAVVDSGVDSSLPGLDGTVSQQVTLTSLPQRAVADGYGHGSFVAEVAAGHAPGDAGAAPAAKIVSLDVMDDDGMAMTSDVIAAADWIYANASTTGIRVANFSLLGGSPSSMQYDPLDKALEKLWFSGVVVVTAAGNFAVDGAPSDEAYAPANDPFVITAGASDISGTVDTADDAAAPWSAYGHTLDGFAKPEVGAPGRYVVETVPTDSTLYTTRPERIVAPGQLQLSGTSFAAPIVAGVAANLLALHPNWTPDQVKGALMLTAQAPGAAAPASLGVGEVNAETAAQVVDPPNPNQALDVFLVPDPSGGPTPVFDTASWGTTVQADASWGTASWGTASWGTASWGTASWGTTYWSSASWGTASWGTASWGTTAAPADNAPADVLPAGAYWMRWTR